MANCFAFGFWLVYSAVNARHKHFYSEHAMIVYNISTVFTFSQGLDVEPTSQHFRRPWHRSAYLCNRILQLAPLMDELDPHEPVNVIQLQRLQYV